jgi:hypothetical protein
MSGYLLSIVGFDQRLVNVLWQPVTGKGAEGT